MPAATGVEERAIAVGGGGGAALAAIGTGRAETIQPAADSGTGGAMRAGMGSAVPVGAEPGALLLLVRIVPEPLMREAPIGGGLRDAGFPSRSEKGSTLGVGFPPMAPSPANGLLAATAGPAGDVFEYDAGAVGAVMKAGKNAEGAGAALLPAAGSCMPVGGRGSDLVLALELPRVSELLASDVESGAY